MNVKVVDITKRLSAPHKGNTFGVRDAKNNDLAADQMVKVINGPHKGTIGPIKHAFKNYLFLWNKDFIQSNGIFVENSRNVIILGEDYLK